MGLDAMILVFWMLSFKLTFSLSSFTFIKRLFSSSSLSAIRVVSSAYLRLLIFIPAILIPFSVQFSLVAQSCLTPWTHESQHTRPPCPLPTPGVYLNTKPMSIESVMPSSHLILCHPLLLLPPVLPSIRVFSNESTLCMRWPKNWSFSFSISPSNEHPGLISFRMDWLDVLAVQGTLKSLLQHHISKAWILQHSVFFTVQLSHPYMTTGKIIALTRGNFVGILGIFTTIHGEIISSDSKFYKNGLYSFYS